MWIGPRLRFAVICAALASAVVTTGALGACSSGGGRPEATARLQILAPTAGQVAGQDVDLRLRLIGGRLVALTTKAVRANEGHVHVFVDDKLVSMTKGLDQDLRMTPGTHGVRAEFVAADHAPFKHPVVAAVIFRVH